MKSYYRLGFIFLSLTALLFSCGVKETDSDFNHEMIIYPDGTSERSKNNIFTVTIKNGMEVSILSAEWMSYYEDRGDYTSIKSYYTPGRETTTPRNPVLRWDIAEECSNFTVLLSKNKNMGDAASFEVTSKSCELTNLFAGTKYYYQIQAHFEDYIVVSRRYNFKTTDFFRVVKIDGVYNVRDIGNKKTKNGKKRVKQGLVYRTANFDSVTALGKTQAAELGIKTDLDLREPGPTESPLGESVNYVNNGVGEYGSPLYYSILNGVNVAMYQPPMRDNLRMFANANNFPLAFHCAVGRDRTGTLAITLYLLLGIKEEQIKQDYAVSYFSKACNETDFEAYNEQMKTLFTYFSHYRGCDDKDNGNIYQRAEEYCLDIGLSKQEITSIRENLLEPIK